jgi:hypothetical protein
LADAIGALEARVEGAEGRGDPARIAPRLPGAPVLRSETLISAKPMAFMTSSPCAMVTPSAKASDQVEDLPFGRHAGEGLAPGAFEIADFDAQDGLRCPFRGAI